LISAYCVYAFDADAGTSTVTEDGTLCIPRSPSVRPMRH